MQNLVNIELKDGIQVIDSRLIAKGLNIKHQNLIETIRKYQERLEKLGTLTFETEVWKHNTGASKSIFCYLNELQCNFVVTLSRNTEEVVDFKLGLVIAFDKAAKGGKVANKALQVYELQTGKKVLSSLNFLPESRKQYLS